MEENISHGLQRAETLWRVLGVKRGPESLVAASTEGDHRGDDGMAAASSAPRAPGLGGAERYARQALGDLDAELQALEEKLVATRRAHAGERAELLADLSKRRSDILCVAAPADCGEVGGGASPAQGRGSSLEIDVTRLMGLDEFDPSAACRQVVEAAMRAASEARAVKRAEADQRFEDERRRLQAAVDDAFEATRVEAERQHALICHLTAKLESFRVAEPLKELPPGSKAARKKKAAKDPCERLELLDASSRAAAAAMRGEALLDESQQSLTRQWGSLFVGTLGVTPSPSKPGKYRAAMADSRTLVPPKIARSEDEALASSVCSPSWSRCNLSVLLKSTSIAPM